MNVNFTPYQLLKPINASRGTNFTGQNPPCQKPPNPFNESSLNSNTPNPAAAPKVSYGPNFCGITNNFKRHFFKKPQNAAIMVQSFNSTAAGTLPTDFLNALKESEVRGQTQNTVAEGVRITLQTLGSTVEAIRELERSALYYYINDDYESFEYDLTKGNFQDAALDFKAEFSIARSDNDEYDRAFKKAEKTMTEGFKKAGIIPEKGKVRLSCIGCGTFGYAIKISCVDEEGAKLFHDKVMKVYKDENCDKKLAKALARKTYNYRKGFDKRAAENYEQKYLDIYKFYNKRHGVRAEANSALFLKDKIGDMTNCDYLEPWFFNFKSGYGIFEMADRELPKPEIFIDCEDYGLVHTDLTNSNYSCQRMVDYGGIEPEDGDELEFDELQQVFM